VCGAGQYSLAGSGVCTNCSAGKFGNTTALASGTCSGLCAAGRYGSVSGLSSAQCEGACAAGYACAAGSTNATAAVCGAGQYSLSGSGVCTNCSAGRFGSRPGLNASSCTAACPTGYYCPPGTTNATTNVGLALQSVCWAVCVLGRSSVLCPYVRCAAVRQQYRLLPRGVSGSYTRAHWVLQLTRDSRTILT
jgi:hypothetical protein